MARGGPFWAHFFDPQIPQEFTCVSLWQPFPKNEAHELLGQGRPSILFVSNLGKVVSPVLGPLVRTRKSTHSGGHMMICNKICKHAGHMKLFPRLALPYLTPNHCKSDRAPFANLLVCNTVISDTPGCVWTTGPVFQNIFANTHYKESFVPGNSFVVLLLCKASILRVR